MITITITEEIIQTQVQACVTKLLNESSSYSNPIKLLAEKQLTHDGPLRDALKAKIDKMIHEIIESPTHDAVIGAAIVQEMAARQIREIAEKKRGF